MTIRQRNEYRNMDLRGAKLAIEVGAQTRGVLHIVSAYQWLYDTGKWVHLEPQEERDRVSHIIEAMVNGNVLERGRRK